MVQQELNRKHETIGLLTQPQEDLLDTLSEPISPPPTGTLLSNDPTSPGSPKLQSKKLWAGFTKMDPKPWAKKSISDLLVSMFDRKFLPKTKSMVKHVRIGSWVSTRGPSGARIRLLGAWAPTAAQISNIALLSCRRYCAAA